MSSEKILQAITALLTKQDERLLRLEQSIQSNPSTTRSAANNELVIEALANSIQEFSYDPENGLTFDKWYNRYEDAFIAARAQMDEQAQIRLLLRKLDQKSHTKYVNYILPKSTKNFDFKTTVDKLKQILSAQITIFSRRYNCLKTKKNDNDDFVTYAGIVNRSCEDFKFTELGSKQFKCLIFISGLQAAKDFEIRARLLRKLLEAHSAENPVTLHDLVNECQRIVSLKLDSALVEKPVQPNVNKIERKKQTFFRNVKDKPQPKASDTPKYPCWNCGGMHYAQYCDYLKHECKDCKKIEHKEGYCASARKSKPNNKAERKPDKKADDKYKSTAKSNVVISVNQIQFQSKWKFVTIQINAQDVKLQIDTASDITLISQET